jgi:hypothetical protein
MAAAMVAVIPAIAAGSTARCGTGQYAEPCTVPHVQVVHPASAKCVKYLTHYTTGTITITSNSGIRQIEMKSGLKIRYKRTFKAPGPLTYRINKAKVKITGLAAGGHTLKLLVVDNKSKRTTKSFHFAVCATSPVFTG